MRWDARILLLLALLASSAFADDASGRRFIREGMSEGEVLTKIGEPDRQSTDSGSEAEVIVKRWIYLPAPGDDQTITTLILRQGKVIEVDRKISR